MNSKWILLVNTDHIPSKALNLASKSEMFTLPPPLDAGGPVGGNEVGYWGGPKSSLFPLSLSTT
jgi:hypothetical protein